MIDGNIFCILDKASFFQLLFVAIVGRLMVKLATDGKSDRVGTVVFVIVLPVYFFRHFSFGLLLDALIAILFRSLLVSFIAYCSTAMIATIWFFVAKKISGRREWNERARQIAELNREHQRLAAERNKPRPPLPPPLTPKERAELFAKHAQEEYDAELALLNSLPLDRDEREVLEMQAKRKLLKRLKERG